MPGHGPVQRDLFADITRQVRNLRNRGLDLDAARTAIDLADWHHRFAGDSPVRAALFRMYVAAPSLQSAWGR